MNRNPFSLQGHTALVTGGTQGVGAAIARSIAAAGADVILHGLVEDEVARSTRAECRDCGVRCEVITTDLSDPQPGATAQLLAAVDELAARGAVDGDVDLLVNNAGVFIDQPFLQMDAKIFQRTLQINVAAGFFLTQAFARRWVEKGIRGRVVFTGSINGILAEPDHVAYDCSKGAVAAMVRSLCVALAPRGIRVNSMAPGLVRSPLTSGAIDDLEFERWMQLHTPSGEVPEAEVCGPATVFLLSDAAHHIHGQTLLVDGGMSAWQQPDWPG